MPERFFISQFDIPNVHLQTTKTNPVTIYQTLFGIKLRLQHSININRATGK